MSVDLAMPERLDATTVPELREALLARAGRRARAPRSWSTSPASGSWTAWASGCCCPRTAPAARPDAGCCWSTLPPRLLRLLAVTRLHRVLHVDRAALAEGA